MHRIGHRQCLLGLFIGLACSTTPRLTAPGATAVAFREPNASLDLARPSVDNPSAELAGIKATYLFDRNRLSDSRLAGSSLLALTDSGHLLRFDAATFALLGERLARRRITCLGPVVAGGLLAGLEDGTIVRVNVETLLAERVGEVPGEPVWLGQRPSNHLQNPQTGSEPPAMRSAGQRPSSRDAIDGLVVAYGHSPERFYGYGRSPRDIRIRDMTSGRIWKPNRNTQTGGEPTTFLIDARDRLWIGTDHGEWGGRLEVIDLHTGSARDVPSRDGWDGVFGLIELSNGQVWAYGGTAHLFCTGAFISRVGSGAAKRLYHTPLVCQDPGRQPGKSANPVTQIVELDKGRILIFAYDEVFVSDLTLKKWRRFARLELRYQPGRPDAVGSYPAVHTIHVADGRMPRLVLATARDGYVELDRSGLHQHALADPKTEDECSRGVGGRRFTSRSAGGEAMGHMRPPPIPIELAKQVGVAKEEPFWGESASFDEGDGQWLVVASGESNGRGTRASPPFPLVVARWDGTSYAPLGGHAGELGAHDAFITPDGHLWALNRQGLWRFDAGHFVPKLAKPDKSEENRGVADGGASEDPIPFRRIDRVVGDREPPWIALVSDRQAFALHRFTPGSATEAPRFEAMPIEHHGMQVLARDVMVWRPGETLVGTAAGLFVLEVKTGIATRFETPGLAGMDIGRLARDRHGRVWIGGRGLWLLDRDGRARALHGALPFFGEQEVLSLIPCRGADVSVGIADRGVALVSLGSGNPAAAEPEDELSRAAEPSREQTVMAHVPWIRDSDLSKQQRADKAFWQLVRETGDLVEARQLGRYGGIEYLDHYVIFFHGPDAEALAASIAPKLAASDAVSSLSLVKRFGPPGSPSVVQMIKP